MKIWTFSQQLYVTSPEEWKEHGKAACEPSQQRHSFHREIKQANLPFSEIKDKCNVLSSKGIYRTPCSCGALNIDESGWSDETRLAEH